MTYRGPNPYPTRHRSARPVVAIFDTGLGVHPWFRGDSVRLILDCRMAMPIGIIRDATDPEVHPSLSVPLDGIFDDASGHGTFIAGIIRQECPEARILPVRVADGEGIILETELIGRSGGSSNTSRRVEPVHVLNLSFSFYHETPDDPTAISEITELLGRLRDDYGRRRGLLRGNEATDRPTYPAALPDTGDRHLSVGALNPADHSVALFSNIGDWVDVYAPGVSTRVDGSGRLRRRHSGRHAGRQRRSSTRDPRCRRLPRGYGVWSGTSFAAPVVAGPHRRAAWRRVSASIDAVIQVIGEAQDGDHSL